MKELKELDLDDNQIKVYLACLNLGSNKVHEISKKSNLIRTTTYGILKSLIEKGLISTVKKNNITYFQATSPKQLLSILEEKKQKIKSVIPQLEKLQEIAPNKHNIEIFEGEEGLKTVINDLLSKPNETILIIGFVKRWLDFSEIYTSIYYRKKKELNIKSKMIIDEKEKNFTKIKKIHSTEFRYLKDLSAISECFIYQDKIAFVSFEENDLKGVIIQDKEMSKLQRILFDQLWRIAKY